MSFGEWTTLRMNPRPASLDTNTAKTKKTYIAPSCKRLTPEQAKDLLLRFADIKDPDVVNMLQCVENIQKQYTSETPH
jgi:hypothetical protein